MKRLLPLLIYRITYRIRLGTQSAPFVGEFHFKSMLEAKELDFEKVILDNLKKYGNKAHFDGIIDIEKVGKED